VAAEGEKLSPITVGASGAQDGIAYGKQACGFAAEPETDEGAIVRGCAHAQSEAAKIKFCYPDRTERRVCGRETGLLSVMHLIVLGGGEGDQNVIVHGFEMFSLKLGEA
jgi:hypothetical protein